MAGKESEHRKAYRRDWAKKKYNSDPEHRKRVNEAQKKNVKLRFAKHHEAVFLFKSQGCRRCKVKDHDILCAHHRKPEGKLFNIGGFVSTNPTLEELKRELKKCTCLCLNCHSKLHALLRRKQDGSKKL